MERDVVIGIANAVDAKLHDSASSQRTQIIANVIDHYIETHCIECGSELNESHRYCHCTNDE